MTSSTDGTSYRIEHLLQNEIRLILSETIFIIQKLFSYGYQLDTYIHVV